MHLPLIKESIIKHIQEFKFKPQPQNLYEPADYIMGLGGKHIRPIFVGIGHQLYDNSLDEIINIALAIEIFHNFTLMHDDLMDESNLRRGMPTVHTKYNPSTAILSGDVMLIHCYELISDFVAEHKNFDLLRIFNTMAIQVCEGQQMDMDFEQKQIVEISDYIEMIRMKTSVLLGTAIEMGACAAGAQSEDRKHLNAFAENFGIAFQLRDDVLDTFGNDITVGKRIGGDIIRNKKTYLYLKSLELCSVKQKSELIHYYSSEYLGSDMEKIQTVTDIMKDVHVLEYANQLENAYQDLAFSHLDQCNVKNEALRQELKSWIETLTQRKK
ncbi:MAG: polyprenyl synthetase family protein [Saprospiraceae bacterium]